MRIRRALKAPCKLRNWLFDYTAGSTVNCEVLCFEAAARIGRVFGSFVTVCLELKTFKFQRSFPQPSTRPTIRTFHCFIIIPHALISLLTAALSPRIHPDSSVALCTTRTERFYAFMEMSPLTLLCNLFLALNVPNRTQTRKQTMRETLLLFVGPTYLRIFPLDCCVIFFFRSVFFRGRSNQQVALLTHFSSFLSPSPSFDECEKKKRSRLMCLRIIFLQRCRVSSDDSRFYFYFTNMDDNNKRADRVQLWQQCERVEVCQKLAAIKTNSVVSRRARSLWKTLSRDVKIAKTFTSGRWKSSLIVSRWFSIAYVELQIALGSCHKAHHKPRQVQADDRIWICRGCRRGGQLMRARHP